MAMMPQLGTFHMDLDPSTHVQLKIANGRCLGYATFESLATLGGLVGAQPTRPVQALAEYGPALQAPIQGTKDTIPKALG